MKTYVLTLVMIMVASLCMSCKHKEVFSSNECMFLELSEHHWLVIFPYPYLDKLFYAPVTGKNIFFRYSGYSGDKSDFLESPFAPFGKHQPACIVLLSSHPFKRVYHFIDLYCADNETMVELKIDPFKHKVLASEARKKPLSHFLQRSDGTMVWAVNNK